MLESNSVCSTTCGDSCFGTIEGQDPLEPKILCVFEDSAWSEEMGLKNCYDNITKPFCEDVVGADPPIDVGEVKCADYVPQWKEVLQDVTGLSWCAATHPI